MFKHQDAAKIWAAGIVDGEGCIYAVKQGRVYIPMLRVCMSDYSTIQRLKRIFGLGSVYSYKPKKKNRKTMWNWAVATRQARTVLEEMLPYLWTKRNQARLATALQDYKDARYEQNLGPSLEIQRSYYRALRRAK